ncbi:MAG TPA: hypothetical protein VHY08_24595 [Bacillota bacterium]|nr:hypothetical protein [Bacillota bacterium]
MWEETEVRVHFTGKSVGFRFSDSWGQNYFNVIIHGKMRVLQLKEWGTYGYLLTEVLPEGMQELILFRRIEARYSGTKFGGLILEKDAPLGPKPEPLPLRIEFYGDSI